MNREQSKETLAAEKLDHLMALSSVYKRRLRALELEEAKFGSSKELSSEIQDIRSKLHGITSEVDKLQRSGVLIATTSESSGLGCATAILLLLASMPGFGLVFLLTIVLLVGSLASLGPWFLAITAVMIIFFFAAGKYLTSGGNKKDIDEARNTLSSATLGIISVFLGFMVSIVVNYVSSQIAQISPDSVSFIATITSLAVGLLGLTFSIYSYVSSREGNQQEIDKTRDSQNIVTDDKDANELRGSL